MEENKIVVAEVNEKYDSYIVQKATGMRVRHMKLS